MPFDMGFDFRSTAGYVTDPAYGVPVLAEAYPHTYTNTNGDSINAGWLQTPRSTLDESNTVDARLAGFNQVYSDTNGGIGEFKIDLASGSAPGAGSYTVDMADGAVPHASATDLLQIKDNTTVISTPIASLTATIAGHFIDVTGVDRTPGSSSWDLVRQTASVTFATTTAILRIENTSYSGNATQFAHFRLTLQGGAAQSVVPVLMAQYRQRRN
jgi:hypothetical protein